MLQTKPDSPRLYGLARGLRYGLRSLLHCDLSESKWGHRVMDQIFREGKFDPQRVRTQRTEDRA